MVYQIKKLEKLPEEINPDNYSYTSHLPEAYPYTLMQELQVRRDLYHRALTCPESVITNKHWQAILETGKRSRAARYRKHLMQKFVHTESPEDSHGTENAPPPKRRKKVRRLKVSIDTRGSNLMLRKELLFLIKAHRKKHKIQILPPAFKPSHIAKIKAYQIIPYIDLLILKAITGKAVTSTIFATYFLIDKDKNFVDKRVKKLARKVLKPGYLEQLDMYYQSDKELRLRRKSANK